MAEPVRSLSEPQNRIGAPLDSMGGQVNPHTRLWKLFGVHRRELTYVLAYASAAGILSLAVPLAVQQLVNSIAFTNLMQPVLVLGAMVFAALGLLGVMLAGQAWVVELVQRRLFINTVVDLAVRLIRVRQEGYDRQHGPELLNRFFAMFALQKAMSSLLAEGTAVLLQTVIGLALIAVYHPLLLNFSILVVAGLLALLRLTLSEATGTALQESKCKFETAAWLEELAGNPTTFRAESAARISLEKANALAEGWLNSRRAHWRILFQQLLALLIFQAVASAMLLSIGGWLVINLQLTLGQLVASEFVLSMVLAGLVKLAKQLEVYFDALANADKLGVLVDLPVERSGGIHLPEVQTGMHVRLASARLSRAERTVLSNGEALVEPGARVGFTGATGVDLAALGELMAGLREPESGAIEYDTRDLRDLALRGLRCDIAYIEPAGIFAGTVLDNLQLGRPGVEWVHLRGALEAVGLWERIQALPAGLESPLTPQGEPLTLGETRQLLLARAIAGNPRLIVVDEVLDGLDPQTQRRVLATLCDPRARWTLIILSRNGAALELMDKVYELENGLLTLRGETERRT